MTDAAGTGVRVTGGLLTGTRLRVVEAVAVGLAFGSVLCWLSTCLVGSFRPAGLARAYWQALPWLRTDTAGIAAFVIAAVSLPVSEYLRLRRRAADRQATTGQAATGQVATGQAASRQLPERSLTGAPPGRPADGRPALLAQAVCEAAAFLATILVGYLSVNAVTHPATLLLHATHLLPWPAEGTVRVLALVLCSGSVAVLRFLRSRTSAPGSAGPFRRW